MAGDRRATSGNLISHRTYRRRCSRPIAWSGVAIAGAAGPVARDGARCSSFSCSTTRRWRGIPSQLDGQGQPVVADGAQPPSRSDAGPGCCADLRRLRPAPRLRPVVRSTTSPAGATRRRTTSASGSGSLHARTVMKLGFTTTRNDRDTAVDLMIRSLFTAADVRFRHRRTRQYARHLPGRRSDHRGRVRPSSKPSDVADRAVAGEPVRAREFADRSESVMNMPFYVAPEQIMKDRADYAQQGHRPREKPRGRRRYDDGIAFSALRTPPATLRKVSEIYDRIAFAGVGRYNEFDQLRIAGIRHADLKGFTYSRDDVDSQALANQYAQMLGSGLHPRDQATGGGDPGGGDRVRRVMATSCSTSGSTAPSATRKASPCSAAKPSRSRERLAIAALQRLAFGVRRR